MPLREALTDPRAACTRSATGSRRPPAGSLRCSAWRPSNSATAATAEDVLWAVWDASGLAARWEEQAEHDNAADRDLDAVLTLFEAAARFTDDLPPGSPRCSSTA